MGCLDVISNMSKIYHMFADAESRDIYINRLDYLITGQYIYMERIIKKYLPNCPVMKLSGIGQLAHQLPKCREIVLYGTGADAEMILPTIKSKVSIFGFCDHDVQKQKDGFHGYPVISPAELVNFGRDKVVFICTRIYADEIMKFLLDNGIKKTDIYDIRSYVPYESGDIYFGEDFLTYDDEEVFVDAGCYDLGTTIGIFKKCRNVKKVYAFEPDPQNYEKCINRRQEIGEASNITIYPCCLWNMDTELQFDAGAGVGSSVAKNGNARVKAVMLDKVIAENDKVTFIKMDIEGAELEALEGARNIIQRDKPKLAICIYHKPEDMLALPLYIKSLVPEYKLYLRHYGNSVTETVLYAVM